MAEHLETIQWRNIRAAAKQLADFCFGSPDDPKYGSCHVAVTTSLTARDGVDLVLEPLPTYTPTGLFVVKRADGKFLDIDTMSGGYPQWVNHVGQAGRFRADEPALNFINGLTFSDTNGPIDLYELHLGPEMTIGDLEDLASGSIRAQALAKLSAIERKALGL